MTRPVSVLTVCLGNICRSPTAQAALEEAATEIGLELEVRSAGTGGWHVGNPPDPRMRAAGARVGLTIDGAAERVDRADLEHADLVLAMDRSNLRDLERLASSAGIATPIVLFRDFDPAAAAGAEVPDPYYGGAEGFEEVVAICRRTATSLVALLAAGGVDAAVAARGSAQP